jgi:elongation factor Ts
MADISIEEIKRLRELTGVGITDAKAALVESDGDFDKALESMRKKGMTKAEKRGEREAREGAIGTYNHDGRIGVLVGLLKDVAMHVAASNPEFVSAEDIPAEARNAKKTEFADKAKSEGKPENMIDNIVEGMLKKHFAERCLLDQPFIKNPDITVGEHVKQQAALMNENVVVRRFSRLALGEVS